MIKVILWRIISTAICVTIGRIWFGDWHVTGYGLFLAVFMTFIHYAFERVYEAARGGRTLKK